MISKVSLLLLRFLRETSGSYLIEKQRISENRSLIYDIIWSRSINVTCFLIAESRIDLCGSHVSCKPQLGDWPDWRIFRARCLTTNAPRRSLFEFTWRIQIGKLVFRKGRMSGNVWPIPLHLIQELQTRSSDKFESYFQMNKNNLIKSRLLLIT